MTERKSNMARKTSETDVKCKLLLDGTGQSSIKTGLGFLDHMLTSLSKHSGIDIELACLGDLHVDDHHSVEDVALVLGTAFDEALGERKAIERFGFAYAPLDEALARCVIDLSGRPFSEIDLDLKRENIGNLATENLTHFFESFSNAAYLTLHIDVLRGKNDHHKAETAFKAFALALKSAIKQNNTSTVPSTKGVI